MKKIIGLFSILFLLSMINALDYYKINSSNDYIFYIEHPYNYCQTTIVSSTGEIISNDIINITGLFYKYTINNFEKYGDYKLTFSCCNSSDVITIDKDSIICNNNKVYTRDIRVNFNGLNPDNIKLIIFEIIFFIGLTMFLFYFQHKINFESWHRKNIKKYEQRNYLRFVLSSLGYNILKNIYIIYYILGMIITSLTTEIIGSLPIMTLVDVMPLISAMYLWIGLPVIGLLLFSNLQEWIYDIITELKNISWGTK